MYFLYYVQSISEILYGKRKLYQLSTEFYERTVMNVEIEILIFNLY